jgi:hypothetical protein
MERSKEFIVRPDGTIGLWKFFYGNEGLICLEEASAAKEGASVALIMPKRVSQRYQRLLGYERHRYVDKKVDTICINDFIERGSNFACKLQSRKASPVRNFNIQQWRR